MPTLFTSNQSLTYYLRLIFVFLLLLIEIVSLTGLFDFHVEELKNSENTFIRLSSFASSLLKFLVSFVAAFFLLISPRILEIFQSLKNTEHTWTKWLVIQLLTFALLVLYTSLILPDSSSNIIPSFGLYLNLEAKWFAVWFALAGFTFLSWLLTFAPKSFWIQLFLSEYRAMLMAVLTATIIWLAVLMSDKIGAPVADVSIKYAHEILLLFFPFVSYNFDGKILGLKLFEIEISPGCSGYEGMVMITVFTALYIWLFHKHLKFPHVFLLFPVGIVAIWIANLIRIVSMIIFGEYVSRNIAMGGLHSQAGWINFTLIAIALITLAHFIFARKKTNRKISLTPSLNTALLIPFLVMMGLLMISSALSAGFETFYPLRIGICAAVLWYCRPAYRTLNWGWSWQAVMIGVAVFIMWILLEPSTTDKSNSLPDHLSKLSNWFMITWLFFRVMGSVIVIPIVEEFAFRGYLLRYFIPDFEKSSVVHFTWISFIVSSVMFGLMHGRWVAGILAGMAFAIALYRRGYLSDAIVAHSVANALIAANVLLFDQWSLWE